MTKRVLVGPPSPFHRMREIASNQVSIELPSDDGLSVTTVTLADWQVRNILRDECRRRHVGDGSVFETNVSADVWYRKLERWQAERDAVRV